MASSSSSTTTSVLSSATSLAESLFQRSLDDLIKSLRSDPASEPSAISRAIAEIRREIRSQDPLTKSIALQKLTYLSSLHFISMSWASFHTLELLPSTIPHIKRLAYLSASLSFHPSTTEVLPLSTHQLHKDLTSLSSNSSTSPSLPSLPLQFLSLSASPDLATHLAPDLVPLLSRPSPLQHKAVASAYRMLSLCPSTVPILFKPLVDCLSSENPLTVSAAIGAFCELSAPPNDPAPYLPLAPEIYKILVNSRSNWALIKAIKIFSRLVPLEPRLGIRVADPICQFLRQSQAKSLVLECVRMVLSCLQSNEEAVQLAIEKIKELLSSNDDPNLRYLGLQTLGMLGPEYTWAIEQNREIISHSLTDKDRSICQKALQLIIGTTTQSNSMETISLLVKQAVKSDIEFSNEILDSVLASCGKDDYALVLDFDWYVSLLGKMARIPHCIRGDEIGKQMIDIGLRVKDARPELVRVSRDLLIDPSLLGNHFLSPCLSACAFISGEYIELSKDCMELLEALLQPRTSLLPNSVRAVYIQSVLKVLSFSCSLYLERDENIFVRMIDLIEVTLGPLVERDDVEVLERIRNIFSVVHLLRDTKGKDNFGEIIRVLNDLLFSDEIGPVSVNAQKRVPVPEGLDLKENLADLAELIGDVASFSSTGNFVYPKREENNSKEVETKSDSLLSEHRKRHGLYYLPTEKDEKESGAKEEGYPLVKDSLVNGESSRSLKVMKPRPNVVRLEEKDEDTLPASSSSSSLMEGKEKKDDSLSGAISNVLLEKEGKIKDRERKRGRKQRHRKEAHGGGTASQEPVVQDLLL